MQFDRLEPTFRRYVDFEECGLDSDMDTQVSRRDMIQCDAM